VRGITERFLHLLTGIYSSLSSKQTNSWNADHPLALNSQELWQEFNMRLRTLYFIAAFAITAIPLSAGAQSLPANHQWTTHAQSDNAAVWQCPRTMIGSLLDISGAALGALRDARHAVKQ
jgi:hypothetical protein